MSFADIKRRAGYVQVEAFKHAREGYFCGTCKAFDHLGDDTYAYCTKLDVPVRSFGCCNLWHLNPGPLYSASGRRLRVIR